MNARTGSRCAAVVLPLLLMLLAPLPAQAATTSRTATQSLQSPEIQRITAAQLRSFHMVPTAKLQEIQRFAAAQETRLQRVMTRRDRLQIASLEKEAKTIMEIENARRRATAIAAYNRKVASFRGDIMKRAGISDAAALSKARELFPDYQITSRAGQLRGVRRTALSSRLSSLPSVLPAPATESQNPAGLVLTEFTEQFRRSGCGLQPTFYERSFHALQSSVLATGCHSDVAVGSSFSVPSGVRRVHVEAELNGYDLGAIAYGAIGYGQANSDLGLRISGPGLESFELDRSVISIAPALAVIDNEERIVGSHYLHTSFEPRSTGGSYVIQVYGGLFTLGVGPGGGMASVAPRSLNVIRVLFER